MKNTSPIVIVAAVACSAVFLSAQQTRGQCVSARAGRTEHGAVIPHALHDAGLSTREAWLERSAFLRKQILASAGLLPMPEKRPLNAQVFGKLERQGYSVEKVLIETLPGFYLGGNLYRPLGQQGPFPGVVSRMAIGRTAGWRTRRWSPFPGRCISLARRATWFSATTCRVERHEPGSSPVGRTARHDSVEHRSMGMQLGTASGQPIRRSLPDVDPARIVCHRRIWRRYTDLLLMAVDERIKAAAPVNMISDGAGWCL